MKLIQTVDQPYQVKKHMPCNFCQKGMFECVSCEISREGAAFYTYKCPTCNKDFTQSEPIEDKRLRELRDNCLPNFKLTKEEWSTVEKEIKRVIKTPEGLATVLKAFKVKMTLSTDAILKGGI